MRCPNCGQRLSDSVVKCPSCGLVFTEEDRLLMSEEEQEQESSREEDQEEQRPQRPAQQSWQAAPLGPVKRGFFDDGLPETEPFHGRMKWYWFIVHIQLLLSTLSFFLNGYMYLTGAFYGDQAATLYGTYPGMSLLDKGFGIFAIVMAVLAIFTRMKLKDFRSAADHQKFFKITDKTVGNAARIIKIKRNLRQQKIRNPVDVIIFQKIGGAAQIGRDI